MAKRRTKAAIGDSSPDAAAENETATTAALTDEQRRLATTCICAITGCGIPEAHNRINRMGEAKVKRLAQLESNNRRRDAVPILYR